VARTANPECPLIRRYRVISERHMLNASSSHLDPKLTSAQGRFRRKSTDHPVPRRICAVTFAKLDRGSMLNSAK
jgi:hypothetical protein